MLETTLDDIDIGSVCSGGRYDNLAELYTNQQLPGIGASLGLDRLLDAMTELGMLAASQRRPKSLFPTSTPPILPTISSSPRRFASAGLAVEVYPEPAKLGKQLQYADRKGFRVALIAGEREFAAGECQVKNLASTARAPAAPLADDATALIRRNQPHLGELNRIVYK